MSECVCVAVGCLTGVGQSDVGQPMPPVPAALLAATSAFAAAGAAAAACCALCALAARLLLLEVDGRRPWSWCASGAGALGRLVGVGSA